MTSEADKIAAASAARRTPWRTHAAKGALIFFAAMFVYIPAMQAKWIWDDNLMITQYRVMHHPDGLRIFWYPWHVAWQLQERFPSLEFDKWFPWTGEADYKLMGDSVPDYYPITWSTLWLEWRAWGDNPPPYHVANCVMHAIGAVLVWLVLARLGVPGAFLAGLIFAVHPVNVCSVAWVTERKNVLSIIFFLLALLLYFQYSRRRRWWWYATSLVMFVMALLSKVSVVMLPPVLLLAAWWQRASGQTYAAGWTDRVAGFVLGLPLRVPGLRIVWRRVRAERVRYVLADVLRAVPFFLLAVGASMLIVHSQILSVIRGHRIYEPGEGTFAWSLAMAGAVPWFYIYKALLPVNLLMIYPRWSINTGNPLWYLPGVLLVASAVALLCLHRRAWARHLILGLGYFVVLLVPVMGFFDMYFYVHSLVADHWQYLSIIGLIALAAGGGTWLFTRYDETIKWVGVALASVVVAVLSVLTWNQTLIYEDQLALWGYNLPRNDEAWMGHYNMGTTLANQATAARDDKKRKELLEQALSHLLRAAELRPDDPPARNNAGLVLMNLGRVDEGIPCFLKALELSPGGKNLQAATNLSLAYAQKGNVEEAIKWIVRAEKMYTPADPDVYLQHAEILRRAGRLQEALEQINKAIEVSPRHVKAHYNRGMTYRLLGRLDEAEKDQLKALSLQPDATPAMLELALIARQRGNRKDAIEWTRKVVLLQPESIEARYQLGVLLLETGRASEGIPHLKLVVANKPDFAEGHSNLAMAFFTVGNIPAAIAEYRRTLQLNPNWAEPMSDLARILSHPQSGRLRNIPEAVRLAERACELSKYAKPAILETLAMVYSEAGRFDDAARTERRLLELVSPAADEKELKQINDIIRHYESGKPYSDGYKAP